MQRMGCIPLLSFSFLYCKQRRRHVVDVEGECEGEDEEGERIGQRRRKGKECRTPASSRKKKQGAEAMATPKKVR